MTAEHDDPFDGPMCHTPARPPLPGRPTTGQIVEAMTGGEPLPPSPHLPEPEG